MNPRDLFYATCPMVIETAGAPYPYRQWGAGFLAVYEEMGVFVTAKHVLRDLNPGDILVFPHDSQIAISFISLTAPTDEGSFADIAFFPFRASVVDADAPGWREKAVPLIPRVIKRGREAYVAGSRLEIASCPGERRGIDYDAANIAATILPLEATYVAPDSDREWIHQARITSNGGLTSLAGVSGAPLYAITPPDWGLAGIVIEAGGEICHFIDSEVIYQGAQVVRARLQSTSPNPLL